MTSCMRLLFLGDMVGRSGRTAVWEQLPGLISDFKLDFVIVNGENAAGGFGITEEIFRETLAAGADVVTTGNHVWDQREALAFAPRDERFLRPANFPKGTPGRGLRRLSSPATAHACSSPTSWAASSCIPSSTIRSRPASANSPPARSASRPTR